MAKAIVALNIKTSDFKKISIISVPKSIILFSYCVQQVMKSMCVVRLCGWKHPLHGYWWSAPATNALPNWIWQMTDFHYRLICWILIRVEHQQSVIMIIFQVWFLISSPDWPTPDDDRFAGNHSHPPQYFNNLVAFIAKQNWFTTGRISIH